MGLELSYNQWLKSRNKGNLLGASILSRRDSSALLNSFSPYDLYSRPNYIGSKILPDTAFNAQNVGKIGIPNVTVVYPNNFTSQENKAIMEHENVHARQLPTNTKLNKGYTTFVGESGNKGISEKSAMKAEDIYWNIVNLLGKTNAKANGK